MIRTFSDTCKAHRGRLLALAFTALMCTVLYHLDIALGGSGSGVLGAGIALELVTGFVTAPSATLTAWTMASGNSLTVRNAPVDSMVRLLSAWALQQTVGYLRIRSPKMHDNVQGVRLRAPATNALPLLPLGASQRLYAQDVLTVEQSGSATGGDIEQGSLLVYYDNLPGQDARLISASELLKRGVNEFSFENTISTGTAGGYSGEEAINAEYDLMKANTDYAIVGYITSVAAAALRWRGVDTANLGVGGPGNTANMHVTANWFVRLSQAFGDLRTIPVINSANKGGTLIDAAVDENGADPIVTTLCVELAPGGGR